MGNNVSVLAKAIRQGTTLLTSLSPFTGRRALQGLGDGTITDGKEPGSLSHHVEEGHSSPSCG